MGRRRWWWLSWWNEVAVSERAAMKTSGYAAGSLLTVADLPVVEVAAILAATDRIEGMSGADRARMLAGGGIAVLVYGSRTPNRDWFWLVAEWLGAVHSLRSRQCSSVCE